MSVGEDGLKDDDVVIINGGDYVFRVSYDEGLHARIVSAVKNNGLGEKQLIQVLADTVAIGTAGYASVGDAVTLLLSYAGQTSSAIWTAIASSAHMFMSLSAGQPWQSHAKAFTRQLIAEGLVNFGYEEKEGEDELLRSSRSLVLTLGVFSGHPDVLSWATEQFAKLERDITAVPQQLHSAVVQGAFAATANAGTDGAVDESAAQDVMQRIKALYDRETGSRIRCTLLRGMTAAPTAALVSDACTFSMSDKVPLQNSFIVFRACAPWPLAVRTVFKYVKENWDDVVAHFSKGQFMLSRVCKDSLVTHNTQAELDDIKAFYDSKEVPDGSRMAVDQGIEACQVNVAVLAREGDQLGALFEKVTSKA